VTEADQWLDLAVQAGDLTEVRNALAAGANPNYRDLKAGADTEGQPALFWAAFGGKTELCELLLSSGARIGASPSRDSNALHAAAEGGPIPLLELLISHAERADLNALDYIGHTPLMCATRCGNLWAAESLLKAGADPNARDEEQAGDPALSIAIRRRDLVAVRLLLANGASPSGGRPGLTALDQARAFAEPFRSELLALLENPTSLRDKPVSNRKRKRDARPD
jgi:cytohesin